MEQSTKHEAKLILTWLISVAMIGLYRVCTLVVRVFQFIFRNVIVN